MDPHSTRSQFNQRAPKSGPKAIKLRFADLMPHSKPSVDAFTKPSTPRTEKSDLSLTRRPIATNSRIKQDEKYRKDMYLAFVHNALQQKTIGIIEPFEELVDQFNLKNQTGNNVLHLAQLRLWISALSHVVSRLDRTHSALVHAIVNMPWPTLDSVTVKEYTVFIGMLVSARPEYLSLVLGKIAQGLTHQFSLQTLRSGMTGASSTPVTRRVLYDRLHDLLRHLLSLVPTLSSTLQPLLVRNFPHKRQNQATQTTYIRNLLRVSVYCPELADSILATIVDRAIQIDVEIQVELEELDDVDENVPDQEVFDFDPFDTVVGQAGDSDSEDDSDDSDDMDRLSDISSDDGDDMGESDMPMNITYIQEMGKKLDAILTLILDHFHYNYTSITTSGTLQLPPPLPELPPIDSPFLTPPFTQKPSASRSSSPALPPFLPPSPLNPPETSESPASSEHRKQLLRNQFLALLSIFDRIILRTFKSRYTQFLVFWYTSLDPEFSDIFQGMLVDRALFEYNADEPTRMGTPVVTRAAAASYIGSFVSRATFVDKECTRRMVGVLCEFLKAHLDGIEQLGSETGAENGLGGIGGPSQSMVFYAVSQAMFLIFCFRWRDLLENRDRGDESLIGGVDKGGSKWMPQLSILQRVVTSVLNPLMVCSTNVVMQFARVAHATDFIYCYTILESNKRSEYASNNEGRRSLASTPPSGIHPAVLKRNVNPELNTFFPFDPYRLAKSNTYIHNIYREWSSVAIDEEDEDEGEDEDDQEESMNFNRCLKIPQPDNSQGDEGGLGESLGKMSISPQMFI